MPQLNPGEYFGISRQLADPNDATTYYIRAVIRNARTDATIDTVDLTARSLQRYSAQWGVYAQSADPLYITITTYVYTDSGYTSLSTDYIAESNTYLIEPREKHLGGGGGGIRDSEVRKIVREELAIAIKEIIASMPKAAEQIKLAPFAEGIITAVTTLVGKDLSTNSSAIATRFEKLLESTQSEIGSKIDSIEPTDLSEVMKTLEALKFDFDANAHDIEKMQEAAAACRDAIEQSVKASRDAVKSGIIEANSAMVKATGKLMAAVQEESARGNQSSDLEMETPAETIRRLAKQVKP